MAKKLAGGASQSAANLPAKRRIESEDDDAKGKKRGPVSCSSCKRRPGVVAWASNVMRSGVETPHGDKCWACWNNYQSGFRFLSWEDFCAQQHAEATSKDTVGKL